MLAPGPTDNPAKHSAGGNLRWNGRRLHDLMSAVAPTAVKARRGFFVWPGGSGYESFTFFG